MRFPSCRMQHTRRNVQTACDAIKKTEIGNACTLKMQRTQPILSLRPLHFSHACIAFFFWSALHDQHALHPLRCIRQLGNRPLSLFSAFWWRRLFRRSARVGQHTIAKFLFMMDEQFVKFDDRRWSGYNYQSIQIKQMDASVSERVCGGLTCRSPGSNVGLC